MPVFVGETLILIDVSGSMAVPLSDKSRANRWEYAALFGLAVARRYDIAFPYAYSDQAWAVPPADSLFEGIKAVSRFPNGGTHTWGTVRETYSRHLPDRIIVLTDEQAHDSATDVACPIYTINLAGYRAAHIASGPRSFTVGGLTDAGFALVSAIEQGMNATWPWLAQAEPAAELLEA